MRPISNSELRAFKRCRRRWWLEYVRGLKAIAFELGPSSLGTRVHRALEAGWSADIDETRETMGYTLEAQRQAELERMPELEADINKEHKYALTMVEGYLDWLEETGEDAGWEELGVERAVQVPFPAGEDTVLVAKLDRLLRRKEDGLVAFLDYKTVDNLTTPLKTLHLGEQVQHYLLLLRLTRPAELGDLAANHGLIQMLRKVLRTKQAKPPFYRREPVEFTDEKLRSYWYRLVGEVTDLRQSEDRLRAGEDHRLVAYPNPTRDCSWDCPYFKVCGHLDAPEQSDAEGLLAELYEVRPPYERYGQGLEEVIDPWT